MSEQAKGAKSVLVVEDQEELRMLIDNVLDNNGYLHEYAANGQEALSMLENGLRPDLILLDVVMPVMDGYQFLEVVRHDSELKAIPVVMLTSLDQAEDVLKAVKRGAADYCTKPIDPDDMLATIKRVLE